MSRLPCRHDSFPFWLSIAVLCVVSPAVARGQADRRRVLQTPGLTLETGAPTAPTHALTFTRDGRHLLAAGADKVVRIWPVQDGKLDQPRLRTLRWATWRERRGAIYAMALSPDEQNRYVAIAGNGLRTGSVAVLDRTTGEVVHGLLEPEQPWPVRAMAFSAGGDEIIYGTYDGKAWAWKFQAAKPRLLGTHTGGSSNPVRVVTSFGAQRVLSIAQDGAALGWNPDGPAGQPKELFRFKQSKLYHVAISGDQKWLAACVDGPEANRVEVRSLDGPPKNVELPRGYYPRVMAFDHEGKRLFIAMESSASDGHIPTVFRLVMLDMVQGKSRQLLEREPLFDIQAMAVHPSGDYVALAGGADCEVSVIDLTGDRIADRVRGPGSSLWGVGLSPDGRLVGFQAQRNLKPADFNDGGAGAWKVFDLRDRKWTARATAFNPIKPLSSCGGWKVAPDPADRYVWWAVAPNGRRFPLPLDSDRDGFPRCYTFLEATDTEPVRLAVGHRWGISLFDLREDGVRRSRLFVGHQDFVASVAPSADQRILVSASHDQTIAGWSLAAWEHHSELGAGFALRDGKLVVADVAAGSPAWEAGLTRDDELLLLAFNAQAVAGGPTRWLERLRSPVPGLELFFRVNRAGEPKPLDMLTTVRQRPLWQFFPTRSDEWVLWRWRDYYYDTSTNGDSYIGWQINGEVNETPQFHRAEQFRERFHRPEKVDDVLSKMVSDPERVAIPELIPPKVELAVHGQDKDKLSLRLTVAAQASAFIAEPKEVSLWINDYKLRKWDRLALPFEQTVEVPRTALRRGTNEVIAQAYNRAGTRGDSERKQITVKGPPVQPNLFGLCVGISDYSRAIKQQDGTRLWDNLFFAAEDAQTMSRIWRRQQGGSLYQGSHVEVLLDHEASRAAILAALDRVARAARPDDRFVLFLAGHGYAKRERPNVYLPRSFAFVCPTFHLEQPAATGISGQALYEALAAIPCRKLLLLDCCHSGSMDVIRELAPERVGPLMLVACNSRENSYDIPFLGHGAFTNSILEAVGERFETADKDRSSLLDSDELFSYVSERVPKTIELARPVIGPEATQTPQRFPIDDEAPAPLVQHVP